MKKLNKYLEIGLSSKMIWMLFVILVMQTLSVSAKLPFAGQSQSTQIPLQNQRVSSGIFSSASKPAASRLVSAISAGKMYAYANGRLSEIFVRIEIENVYTLHDGPYQGGNPANGELYHTTADVYVRFYSDASFTVPYTISNDMNINIKSSWTQTFQYSPQNNTGGSGDSLWPVYANTSEQLLGNFNTHGEFISYDEPAMPTNEYIATFEVLGQYFD